MPFEKIESKKKSAYIIEQIVAAIQNGEYKVGQKLPAEREIAQEMGVSRPSVREALCVLQTGGILESKAGEGNFISMSMCSEDFKIHLREMLKRKITFFISETNESRKGVFAREAREIIEGEIAQLAIRKATKRDLTIIEQHLEDMYQAAEKELYEKYFEADKNFHLSIATSTKNPFLKWIMNTLLETMESTLWEKLLQNTYYLAEVKHMGKAVYSHKDIFLAIRDNDQERVSQAVKDHFMYLNYYLLSNDE